MLHPIYRVVFFQIQAPYTLRVYFDDDTETGYRLLGLH